MPGFLADIIRDGVQLADGLTKDLQVQVQHFAWIGYSDASGSPAYAAPIQRLCIISTKQSEVVTASGKVISLLATLLFVGDVQPNGTPGRKEPFDPRDIIILPNGSTGPIIDTPSGVNDPETNRGFTHKVLMGRDARQMSGP